jgi:DNA-binding NarL/FixJ family response regulator
MLHGIAEPEELSAEPTHARAALDGLTAREGQIVALIAVGASNKEIAHRLAITERTVKAHLTNVFQKLGLSSRLHLAIRAISGAHPA